MRHAILVVLLILPFIVKGQYQHKFFADPDSAIVYLNDEKRCHTPCKLNFYWGTSKSAEDQIVFTMKAPGYKTWTQVIDKKPKTFFKDHKASLELDVPEYHFDSLAATVGFDKIVNVNLSEKEIIGELRDWQGFVDNIQWHTYYEREFDLFKSQFYKLIESAGFPSAHAEEVKVSLFNSAHGQLSRKTRFLVGAELVGIKMDMEEVKNSPVTKGGEVSVSITVDIKWKVYDKERRREVHLYENTTEHNSRNFRRTYDFSLLNALKKSLVDFLAEGTLASLVENSEQNADTLFLASKDSRTALKIRATENRDFESIGSLIKHSSDACVTVMSDYGHGSGVIIDESGLMLTAYHVIENSREIQVQFNNGLLLNGHIVASDKASDIVLIKIDGAGFKPLPISQNSSALGDDILTIGTPIDPELGQSIAKGIVSGKRLHNDIAYLQFDMAVSPGNSGGPILNQKGEIIGLVQRKIVDERVEGIGFGIPIEQVLEILRIEIE